MSVLDNCLVFLHKRVAIPQRTKMECVYRRMIKGYAYKMAFPHKIVLTDDGAKVILYDALNVWLKACGIEERNGSDDENRMEKIDDLHFDSVGCRRFVCSSDKEWNAGIYECEQTGIYSADVDFPGCMDDPVYRDGIHFLYGACFRRGAAKG